MLAWIRISRRKKDCCDAGHKALLSDIVTAVFIPGIAARPVLDMLPEHDIIQMERPVKSWFSVRIKWSRHDNI